MARGGDVFVLEMGKAVKIADLARRMVQLSGLEVKDERHLQGDIEIIYTGLRPGEKLYEELLIGANVTGTGHPKIMRAHEEHLSRQQLEKCLAVLRQAEAAGDCRRAREILEQTVKGFAPAGPVVDYQDGGPVSTANGIPLAVVAGGGK
ncbi:MAG: polysaccharide biosynthesis protein [Desulfurivibrio sp.]|nr:polysaccharide biosynthesis protein [Desulfurivibrio sp.]